MSKDTELAHHIEGDRIKDGKPATSTTASGNDPKSSKSSNKYIQNAQDILSVLFRTTTPSKRSISEKLIVVCVIPNLVVNFPKVNQIPLKIVENTY